MVVFTFFSFRLEILGKSKKSELFKGHLRYKMITSQMCHLKHRLRIFLFHRKIMFLSQDIQVFIFLTIP